VETEVGGIGEVSVYPTTAKDTLTQITWPSVTFGGLELADANDAEEIAALASRRGPSINLRRMEAVRCVRSEKS
jgi:hypothetical protein